MLHPLPFLPTAPVPCIGRHDLFDPPASGSEATGAPFLARLALARRICNRCPVINSCATHARDTGEWGVWGGTSDEDRGHAPNDYAERPRVTKRAPERDCGTAAAMRAHWARGQSCTVCEAAHAERLREQRLAALDREHALPAGGSRNGWHLHRLLDVPRDGCGCLATMRKGTGNPQPSCTSRT